MKAAFVLTSYRRDSPAGMERSVAALCDGLRGLGHQAVVLSADAGAVGDPGVVMLRSLDVCFPCDDHTLRLAINGNRRLVDEIESIVARLRIDVVSYVDALWGLGLVPAAGQVRRVLMVHVVGHRDDMRTALGHRPDVVVAPSGTVLLEAARAGHNTSGWRVVPNALLVPDPVVPGIADRELLRLMGPARVLARLGTEKGVFDLLHEAPEQWRWTELALASAGFEADDLGQPELLRQCEECASTRGWLETRAGVAWSDVPRFLARASVVIVPSHRETFGLVALEAMSVGTPVVARAVGNLPELIGPAGVLVPADARAGALWEAAGKLLADAAEYGRASRAGVERARGYRPVDVAARWLEVVMP